MNIRYNQLTIAVILCFILCYQDDDIVGTIVLHYHLHLLILVFMLVMTYTALSHQEIFQHLNCLCRENQIMIINEFY